jgi:hypothetical protein
MPVNAVHREPPAFFATLSQSMRLKTSLTAPAAFVSRALFDQAGDDALDQRDLGIFEIPESASR